MLNRYLRDIEPYYSAYLEKQKQNQELANAELHLDFDAKSAELYSSWLELIWYQRSINYGRYIAVIFFDPLATTSPKNPNGFGPLVFNEVKLKDIQALINADSPGREYLDNWAYGNKPDAFLEAIYEERQLFQEVGEVLKDLDSVADTDLKSYFANKQKVREILEDYPSAVETLRDIDFSQIDSEFEKLLGYKKVVDSGSMNLYFLGKRILLDFEDIFAININKRIGFRLLSGLTGGNFGANQYCRFRFYLKGIGDILSKDEYGERTGIKGINKQIQRILRNRNPFTKGEFSREKLIIYQNVRDNISNHFKDKKLAKEFVRLNINDIDIKTKTWKSSRIKGNREWRWRKIAKKTIRFVKVLFL